MKRVHLVDCGLGNLRSVSNAFESLGCDIVKCQHPGELRAAEHIVLPGVGALESGMKKLNESGLKDAVISAANSGSRLLGICLGMQLLFDKSYEFGEHEGLHLIPGEVRRMDVVEHDLRLPHIGWNDTFFIKDDSFLRGLRSPSYFYYVNSFSCVCADRMHVLAEYDYGKKFVSIVRKGNIFGAQFHPEKSQQDGIGLLKNFLSE